MENGILECVKYLFIFHLARCGRSSSSADASLSLMAPSCPAGVLCGAVRRRVLARALLSPLAPPLRRARPRAHRARDRRDQRVARPAPWCDRPERRGEDDAAARARGSHGRPAHTCLRRAWRTGDALDEGWNRRLPCSGFQSLSFRASSLSHSEPLTHYYDSRPIFPYTCCTLSQCRFLSHES